MRRLSRLIAVAALTLAPLLAIAQGQAPVVPVPNRSANDNSSAPANTRYVDSATQILLNAIGTRAPLDNPVFRGTVTAPAYGGNGSAVTAPRGDGALQRLDGMVPALDIARAEIPSRTIVLRSFVASGYAVAGDAGAGARYVRGTSAGPMAIQDAVGTWWQLDLSSRDVPAGWWGAVAGGGGDAVINARAINAGLAALGARGGGRLRLPEGSVLVGETVEIASDYVTLSGYGTVRATYGSPRYSTVIVPAFAGTVLRHRTPPDADHLVNGGGFVDLAVIGNGRATRLLEVDTVWGGTYKLHAEGSVGPDSVYFMGGERSNGGVCIQHADIDISVNQTGSGPEGKAHAVVFAGGPNSNVSLNERVRLDVSHQNGDGLRLINSDNNIFWVRTHRLSSGTGASVRSMGGTSQGVSSRANIWKFLSSNSPAVFEGTDTAIYPSRGNIIHIDTDNGTPMPIVGPGAQARVVNAVTAYTPVVTALTGSPGANAFAAGRWFQDANGRVTAFVTIVLPNGSGASGALLFTLPIPIASTAIEGSVTGKDLNGGKSVAGTVGTDGRANLQYYDGGFVGHDNMQLRLKIEYEG